jgi:DNA modification methylase
MGSGSLAISCINNKRNYLGCELDEVYYDEIINRIEKNESPQ